MTGSVMQWVVLFSCVLGRGIAMFAAEAPVASLAEKESQATQIMDELVDRDGYRLDDQQALRRITPPFGENRSRLYPLLTTKRVVRNGRVIQRTPKPESMVFVSDGKHMKYVGKTVGEAMHLGQLLHLSGYRQPGELEISAELSATSLPGDWVIRENASGDDFLYELQAIIPDELQLPIQLAFREVEREVYVAKGTYYFQPIAGFESSIVDPRNPDLKSDVIQFMPGQPDPDSPASYNGPGSCSQMVTAICGFQDVQIVDETSDPVKHSMVWRFHHANRNLDHLLKSIGQQTGLTFEKETRKVRRLIVEPKPET